MHRFHHSTADCFNPTQAILTLRSAPLPPGRKEMFLPCIWSPVLSRAGAIGSPVVLEFVVSSKTDNVSCSSGGFAVSPG
jgi:hypothetical protein